MRGVVVVALLASCRSSPPETPPPPRPSAVLPVWFGSPMAPARRIAGTLYGGAGRVHLRIDAPDPTIWTGLDLDVGPDGKFDFGLQRAGHYHVLATAAGKISRLVDVDTSTTAAEAVDVYAWPCTEVSTRAVPDATIDVGGVVVATANATGDAHLCITRDQMHPTVRAAGYAVDSLWVIERQIAWPSRLDPGQLLRGRVVGEDGFGVANAAVQPIQIVQDYSSHGPRFRDLPLQAVTDEHGRFAVLGVPEFEEAHDGTHLVAKYDLRVLRGDNAFVAHHVEAIAGSSDEVTVDLTDCTSPKPPSVPHEDATLVGHVTVDGRPLADATVYRFVVNRRLFPTRTRDDGGFELDVPIGPSRIHIEHATGVSTDRDITVDSGGRRPIEFALGAMSRVDGVALNPVRQPFAKVQGWLVARDEPIRRYSYTGSDGAFSFDVERGLVYDLELSDGEGSRATAVVDLTTGDDFTHLQVVLKPE